jgi:hypothetical protein
MSNVKYTKTATFIFPLLEIPKDLFTCNITDIFGRVKYTNRFINAYLQDENITKYQSCNYFKHVFLVVRGYRDKDFETFYSTLIAFENYVDDYSAQDCLIFVFNIPKNNIIDFNFIVKGAYSRITAKAKRLILTNNFFSGKPYTLPLILNKAEVLKNSWEERLTIKTNSYYSPGNLYDQEVWPIMELEKETLTKEVLLSLSNNKNALLPSEEF